MKRKRYLSDREPERVTWLNTFASQIAIHGPTVGVSAAEIAMVQAMALIYAFIIGLIDLSRSYTEELTNFKNTLSFAKLGTVLGTLPALTPGVAPPLTQAGIFSRIGEIVIRLKKHNGYTTSIGEALGVIGDEITFDETTFAPELKGKAMPGSVRIDFDKVNIEGMAIYSLPAGSTDPNVWEKLGVDNHPPYHDTRPLRVAGTPEIRKYKARGVINDLEIGQYGPEISVTFSG